MSEGATTPVAVSVIIPALDAEATIAVQLEALAQQDLAAPWEVLVVDNGSRDGTLDVCARFAERLPNLRTSRCTIPGTSAARNAGAAQAAGDKLVFCDADDEVAPGWLSALVDALDAADAVGGAIENDKLNDPTLPLPRHPDHLPVVAGFLPRAITANLGVRREAFEAVGGFAQAYDYGGPDTEFCWRLQLQGYSLAYEPRAVVHYRHRQTLRSTAKKAYRTGRSRGRLYRDYGHRGMPRARLLGALWRWARLLAALPALPWSQRTRWWWVEQASAAAGRLVGSFQHRVVYL